MTFNDPLERLEGLARLRDAGALNEAEFEHEKALLLQQERTSGEATSETAGPALAPLAPARKSRWPLLIAAGLAIGWR